MRDRNGAGRGTGRGALKKPLKVPVFVRRVKRFKLENDEGSESLRWDLEVLKLLLSIFSDLSSAWRSVKRCLHSGTNTF